MVIDKLDELGCSKSTVFDVQLIDENCKPVCHDLRRLGRVKAEFVDD